MRKMVALLLVLIALLGLTARAESNASIVRLSGLALSYVEPGGARSVRFNSASMRIALGASEGAPTIQATFDNGEGQAVDGVAQIVGREILLSMGGITGTYAVDLETFATEGNSGDDIAKGLSGALSLAGAHLDVVLYAITREEANGMRALEVPLPVPQLITAAEGLLSVTAGMDATQDMDMDELRERMENMGEDAMLGFRYNASTGAFELAAVQGGRGMRLSGTMEMSFEPTTFIDITDDEEKYDLLHMPPEVLEQLRGELNMILTKFVNFADGSGLNGIIP